MSETCVCGGSTTQPNEDCERCQLVAAITALRTELAAAKQRVAELEEALNLWMSYDAMDNPDPLSILSMARNATATLLRITHIPGKEDDDGGMH